VSAAGSAPADRFIFGPNGHASPLFTDLTFLKTLEQCQIVVSKQPGRTRGPGARCACATGDGVRLITAWYASGDDPRSTTGAPISGWEKYHEEIYETELHIPVRSAGPQ